MLKSWAIAGVWILWTICISAAELISFDQAKAGTLPAGWTSAMTHKGGPPRWEVVQDMTAPSAPNVLAQLSNDATAGRFPLAIYDKLTVADGSASVRFRNIAGSVDQAAGLVWRYKDPENYYIVRANALESNVVLYRVQNGERLALAPRGTPSKTYGVKHDIPKGVWCSLTVEFEGANFKVYVNGEMLFAVVDSTFPQAGKVGLWTKADSITYFDDLRIERKANRRHAGQSK